MTIPKKLRNKAKKIFIKKGKTLDEVAQVTGLNLRTVQQWSAKEHWMEHRLNYNRTLEEAEFNLPALYKSLIDKASKSLNIQDMEAALRLRTILEKDELL